MAGKTNLGSQVHQLTFAFLVSKSFGQRLCISLSYIGLCFYLGYRTIDQDSPENPVLFHFTIVVCINKVILCYDFYRSWVLKAHRSVVLKQTVIVVMLPPFFFVEKTVRSIPFYTKVLQWKAQNNHFNSFVSKTDCPNIYDKTI